MSAKNSIKEYVENGIYHIYNRGVNKADIFADNQDFTVFCSYLKDYLLRKDTINLNATILSKSSSPKEKDKALKLAHLKNFSEELNLLCYSLLPNHFHLLVQQTNPDTIGRFIHSVGTRYSVYFNRKNKRVGPVFQGRYKAVLVETDEQLLHLSRYIHLNPIVMQHLKISDWREITWPFSLPEYLGARNTGWVKPNIILDYFRKGSTNNSYESFLAENADSEFFAPLAIDFDSE